ncbi:MAG: DUF4407 domain-containing protein [Cyclobacteriaceae bacterium]
MEKVKNFFWFCSGASFPILKKCPTDDSKYFGIGGTVLFTGIFAALAGGYALYTVFDNWFWAVLFSLLWGLMIFNLDRFIVSSMRKREDKMGEFLMATPRIILAVIIAMVISKPLELKIFEQEIETEMRLMEEDYFQQRIEKVNNRYSPDATNIEQTIARLKSEIETKTVKRDELAKIAQQEADGTGGSGKRNPGPIYQIKKRDADKAQLELEELRAKNEAQIAALTGELDALKSTKGETLEALELTTFSGFAYRLEALERLGEKNPTIAWANLFILILFIAIETAPVFVKLISPKGPYDEVLEVHEHAFRNKRLETVTKRDHETAKRLSLWEV